MDNVNKVQMLPAPKDFPRVETGAVQFGDDWPGLFIRGDGAHVLMGVIRQLRERLARHPEPEVTDLLVRLSGYADLILRDVIV